MLFDLSKKIVNPNGQETVYPKNGKMVQHDVLSLATSIKRASTHLSRCE